MPFQHVIIKFKSADQSSHRLLAILSASFITVTWAGWIIFSRLGVQTSLTPADITILRFGTGALFALPFSLRYDWTKLTLWKAVVVALGCGFPYTMFSFYGLEIVKAAKAGVIVNGLLPVFGAALAFLALGERQTRRKLFAIAIILMANFLMMGLPGQFSGDWSGWLLLIGASFVFSTYMFLGKRWGYGPRDVLAFLPLINALLFIPLWLLSDSGIAESSFADIFIQSAYQGVLVSVVALMLTFYAMRHIGAMNLSMFFSFVPFITAILAWITIGEDLSVREIVAIVLCSGGLLMYARK